MRPRLLRQEELRKSSCTAAGRSAALSYDHLVNLDGLVTITVNVWLTVE